MKELTYWREQNGFALEEVAELTGLTAERLAELEATDATPVDEEPLLLGLAYRIDPEEITGYAKVFNIRSQRPDYHWGQSLSILHHQCFAGYLGIRVSGRSSHYFVPVTRSVSTRVLSDLDDGDRFIMFPALTNEWIAINGSEIADIRFVDADCCRYAEFKSEAEKITAQLRLPPSLYRALILLLKSGMTRSSARTLLEKKLMGIAAEAGVANIESEIAIYGTAGDKHSLPAWCDGLHETVKAIWSAKPVIPFNHEEGMVQRRFRASSIAMISIPLVELKEAVDANNPLYVTY